jgi:hypothetical protein
MDIISAFRNSPIWPPHKPFLVVHWNDAFFVDHCCPFGLRTAGGIQGVVADAVLDILAFHGISNVFKWVDDFCFFREPISSSILPDGLVHYNYAYNLENITSITSRLGIPWHLLSVKGHDFQSSCLYVGFHWLLVERRVLLPEEKRLKYTARISSYLASPKVSLDETMKLHGTLQHVTFIIPSGNSYLPSLSRAIVAFKGNKFKRHHIARDVYADLAWWSSALTSHSISRSILPLSTVNPLIWVDASTSWGIGIVVKDLWAAWKLADGWRSSLHDIGWAECIAMELAVMWIASAGFKDVHVLIHGDNTGVLAAILKGRSRNPERNLSIRRMSNIILPINILIKPIYIPSADNLADPYSRGELGPFKLRLPISFSLPVEISHLLIHV